MELIRQSEGVKETVSIRVTTGKYVLGNPGSGPTPWGASYAAYNALQSLGLLVIRDNPPVEAWYDVTKRVPAKRAVYLTAEGQSRAAKASTTYTWMNQDWLLTTASGRDVVAVTGIRTEGKGQATADFTWKWKLNDLGESLARAGCFPDGSQAGKDANPLRSGSATFALYDDGWRLEGIHWGAPQPLSEGSAQPAISTPPGQVRRNPASAARTLRRGIRLSHYRYQSPTTGFVFQGAMKALYLRIFNCEGGCSAYVNGVRVETTPPGQDGPWVNVTNRLVAGMNTFRLDIRRGAHGTSYGLQVAKRRDINVNYSVISRACGQAGSIGCGQATSELERTVKIW